MDAPAAAGVGSGEPAGVGEDPSGGAGEGSSRLANAGSCEFAADAGEFAAGSRPILLGAFCAERSTLGFDFDSTLAPFRGRGPPAALTLAVLAALGRTFNVVIVSNAAGRRGAIAEYARALEARGVRASVLLAAAAGDRKPGTALWDRFRARAAGGGAPRAVAFCGDAAGRPGDFAASDYAFARNIGARFFVPENFFGGGPAIPPGAPPESVGCSCLALARRPATVPVALAAALAAAPPGRPWLLVLSGLPACGKTRLARAVAAATGARVLSADDYRGKPAWKAALAELSGPLAGRHAVVDATNLTPAHVSAIRGAVPGRWMLLCQIRAPKLMCLKLNEVRAALGEPSVPDVAIHTASARMVPMDSAFAEAVFAAQAVVLAPGFELAEEGEPAFCA